MTRHRPGRAEFDTLARIYPIVPVSRAVLADHLTPVGAFGCLSAGARDSFLLESVEGGERWARYSFIGGDAFATVEARDGRVEIEGSPPARPRDGEPPLAYVRRLLAACRAPELEHLPRFHGGGVGYIGYDCVRELEWLPDAPPDDVGLPDLSLLLTRTFVVFDHLAQRALVVANVPVYSGATYDDGVACCEAVAEELARSAVGAPLELDAASEVDFCSAVDDSEFAAWVARAQDHIRAGDIFQVVPSRRFETSLPGAPFDAYRVLRTINPSPYMYYLRFGARGERDAFHLAGSSPEPLVRVTKETVVTRPIAGTRARGPDEAADAALEADLLADAKERSEHIMLVDLARNDVGRVARYGSVSVDELMSVERYSHVMHIVSNVSGLLAPGCTAFDALGACFPAGTVSGAPKVRAMEIIDSLEVTRRGPYAGVVGYFDFAGNLDTCITIRTIVVSGRRAYVQAGAGVVADSVPELEAEETRRKAEALLRACAAASSSRLVTE